MYSSQQAATTSKSKYPAQKYQDELDKLKDHVRMWFDYFKENNDRFRLFQTYVFATTLSQEDIATLVEIGKPTLEVNILETFVSHRLGEFAKQEPSFEVRLSDDVTHVMITDDLLKTAKFYEDYFREAFNSRNNGELAQRLFRDQLTGGYSAAEIYIDYASDKSFEKNIYFKRVYDPTMTFFDPLAKESHKGDGEYCGVVYPMSKVEFEIKYGKGSADALQFSRSLGEFAWSYNNQYDDVVLVCDYYKKKHKKTKIVKLSNNEVMTSKEYEDYAQRWEQSGRIELVPSVVDERMTSIVIVCRYTFCEDKILEYTETDFKFLPIVFFDGYSVDLQCANSANVKQMTRPMVYQAIGMQKLKNYTSQTIAAEIENMVMHKFKVAIESMPKDKDYQDAYRDIQKADVLFYNAYREGNSDQPLPVPTEIQRTQTPQIVSQIYTTADQMIQSVLGFYDPKQASQSNDLSGRAIQAGALYNSPIQMPYLQGFINGINRLCTVSMDLIPKYVKTPRSIPTRGIDGKRKYVKVNQPKDKLAQLYQQGNMLKQQAIQTQQVAQANPQMQQQLEQQMQKILSQADIVKKQIQEEKDSVSLHYNPDSFFVTVEAGINTEVQQQIALEQLTAMMKSSQTFNMFMNEMGLQVLLDNMNIRGIDQLKVLADQFQKQMQEQQANKKPSPEEMLAQAQLIAAQSKAKTDQANLQIKQSQLQSDNVVQAGKLAVDNRKLDIQEAQTVIEAQQYGTELDLKSQKVDAENARSAVDAAIGLNAHKEDIKMNEHQRKMDKHDRMTELHDRMVEKENMKFGRNDRAEERQDAKEQLEFERQQAQQVQQEPPSE